MHMDVYTHVCLNVHVCVEMMRRIIIESGKRRPDIDEEISSAEHKRPKIDKQSEEDDWSYIYL